MTTTVAPAITGIAHIEFSVSQLERSVDWYCRLLGAREIFRDVSEKNQLSAVAIYEPNSRTVLAFTCHNTQEPETFTPRRVGLDHASFAVADEAELEAWAEHLEALVVPFTKNDEGYAKSLNFLDPDGIALEAFLAVRRG